MKIICLTGLFVLLSLNTGAEVYLHSLPPSVNPSKAFIVKADNKVLSLLSVPSRYGNNISYGIFSFTDSAMVEIKTNFPSSGYTKWRFLPESDSIKYKIQNNGTVSFKLYKPTQLTVILNGDYRGRTLHLVAANPSKDAPKPDSPGLLYFEPGIHDIPASANKTISLESNRKLYLAPGAIIKGYIKAENAENIKIFGQGIIIPPGDSIIHNAIDFEACSNISINDISIILPEEGNGIFVYKSDEANIRNITIINPAIWESNGVTIANSSNINISGCLIRSGGNVVSVKGIGNNREFSNDSINPGSALPASDISVKNCRFWSDNNNAVSIGPETLAEYISDIHVSDCDIMFVRDEETNKAALSVLSLQSTDIYNVTFQNLRIYTSGQLIVIRNTDQLGNKKGSQSWPGEIHNISFDQIQTFERGNDRIQIDGWDSTKLVRNIHFDTLISGGDTLNADSPLFNLNQFTTTITVNGDTIKKPVQDEPVTSTY
ncbi:glycosyl hydrolase family 28 protein [Saccharicrinis sp. FJH54]|uniref:glycosyl hydrolase family 28 protein n=1 Tax=Saccharicrinis sp. FJH54 TaxID=3344665 RepID=UPI0035D4A0C0